MNNVWFQKQRFLSLDPKIYFSELRKENVENPSQQILFLNNIYLKMADFLDQNCSECTIKHIKTTLQSSRMTSMQKSMSMF